MQTETINEVIIIGPIAVAGRPALGGFQSSNLRLAGVISWSQLAVSLLRYPDIIGSLPKKLWLYATSFPGIALSLLARNGSRSIVHFTPHCRHFLPFELVIALCAKTRGYNLVVDIRAGSRISQYRERGPAYQAMFRRLLLMADAIAYEGKPYGPFIQQIVGISHAEWLPNFVPAGIIRKRQGPNATGPNLVYVGRLSKEKGVVATVAAFQALREICPDSTLTLIGAWDPKFARTIDPSLLEIAGLTVAGSLPEEAVLRHLDDAHFFTFLSQYRGEGHSNALTEAMARGCVPVVTRHGFSEAVVEDTGVVVENRDDSQSIAMRIAEIWTTGEWIDRSHAATERVGARFSDKAIAATLTTLYNEATKKRR
jgi:glycosyltransferase involved in cell wall biosynthesis